MWEVEGYRSGWKYTAMIILVKAPSVHINYCFRYKRWNISVCHGVQEEVEGQGDVCVSAPPQTPPHLGPVPPRQLAAHWPCLGTAAGVSSCYSDINPVLDEIVAKLQLLGASMYKTKEKAGNCVSPPHETRHVWPLWERCSLAGWGSTAPHSIFACY